MSTLNLLHIIGTNFYCLGRYNDSEGLYTNRALCAPDRFQDEQPRSNARSVCKTRSSRDMKRPDEVLASVAIAGKRRLKQKPTAQPRGTGVRIAVASA